MGGIKRSSHQAAAVQLFTSSTLQPSPLFQAATSSTSIASLLQPSSPYKMPKGLKFLRARATAELTVWR